MSVGGVPLPPRPRRMFQEPTSGAVARSETAVTLAELERTYTTAVFGLPKSDNPAQERAYKDAQAQAGKCLDLIRRLVNEHATYEATMRLGDRA